MIPAVLAYGLGVVSGFFALLLVLGVLYIRGATRPTD